MGGDHVRLGGDHMVGVRRERMCCEGITQTPVYPEQRVSTSHKLVTVLPHACDEVCLAVCSVLTMLLGACV